MNLFINTGLKTRKNAENFKTIKINNKNFTAEFPFNTFIQFFFKFNIKSKY